MSAVLRDMADQKFIGDWVLDKEIGSGSFAKVWRATHRITQQTAAVKEINMEKLNKKLLDSLRSEVTVLKHTKHHNIVCLLDLIQDTAANKLYIVLEFCAGGDLGYYIKRYRQVSEATARYFLQQLAEGLKELRRHNVIHRDLKPQNLLLSDSSSTPLLKIADFGFARSLAPQGLAETLCGSPLYMAPEILQFHKYDAKADLWSIGTILFELLVGKPPFNGANHMQLLRNIERNEARLPEAVAARLSAACKGLLGRLLQRNPVERITFEEFFQHPFLSGDTGIVAGVPPSLPFPAAAPQQPAPAAALPAAMRQAAAAATTAAATDANHKASTAGLPRPSLHLHGPPAYTQHAVGHSSHAVQQQQQFQHGVPTPWLQQQQPVQVMPATPPQHVQLSDGLVPCPVNKHPLAPTRHQQDNEHDALSDSMEGDFVVVHNPSGSAAQGKGSGSNSSSSKASSGLVDPKAAAVLAGAPVDRSAWTGQATGNQQGRLQYQQQQQAVMPPVSTAQRPTAGMVGLSQQQQQQTVSSTVAAGGAVQLQSHSYWAAGRNVSTVLQSGSTMLQTCATLQSLNALQRVQLLIQVVRGCAYLLARQGSPAAAAAATDTGLSATQQGEQFALMLLALQVVQAICLPHSVQQPEEQHSSVVASSSSEVGVRLSAMLAAAGQSDLEQLMSGAVELLQLARGLSGLAGTTCMTDNQEHGHIPMPVGLSTSEAVQELGAGIGHMAQSLLDLPLPDSFTVLHKYALESCREAAVEEVMGNWQASIAGYSLAADLLLFLSCEWPQLGLADPALLHGERDAMHALYLAVNARLAAVVAEAPSVLM